MHQTDNGNLRKSEGFGISAGTVSTSASAISVTTHEADCIPKDICSMRSGRSSCPHLTQVKRHPMRKIYIHNPNRDEEERTVSFDVVYGGLL